jgi:hypothetical protein
MVRRAQAYATTYEKHLRHRNVTFEIGDMVLRRIRQTQGIVMGGHGDDRYQQWVKEADRDLNISKSLYKISGIVPSSPVEGYKLSRAENDIVIPGTYLAKDLLPAPQTLIDDFLNEE